MKANIKAGQLWEFKTRSQHTLDLIIDVQQSGRVVMFSIVLLDKTFELRNGYDGMHADSFYGWTREGKYTLLEDVP